MHIDTILDVTAKLLGITAGLLHIIAFVIYNRQMLEGTSKPNSATWTLWVFLTVLNATSYSDMSGDWVKNFLPIVSSAAVFVTFLVALFLGKFSKLDSYDLAALVVGCVSGFAWWYYQSAAYANLILQLSILISFIPTYKGVWRDSKKEKSLPWFIWTSAYVLSLIVIYMRWEGQWEELAYPVNCFFLHVGVGFLAGRIMRDGSMESVPKRK